jgi:hypothetical protein
LGHRKLAGRERSEKPLALIGQDHVAGFASLALANGYDAVISRKTA